MQLRYNELVLRSYRREPCFQAHHCMMCQIQGYLPYFHLLVLIQGCLHSVHQCSVLTPLIHKVVPQVQILGLFHFYWLPVSGQVEMQELQGALTLISPL